jgi:hypothetical protein
MPSESGELEYTAERTTAERKVLANNIIQKMEKSGKEIEAENALFESLKKG